jgi:hypothetical protein
MTVEIYAHIWKTADEWKCGIVDHRRTPPEKLKPDGEVGYSALSSLDPDLLIYCYGLGGLPSDEDRDYCRDLIVGQALAFYDVLHAE